MNIVKLLERQIKAQGKDGLANCDLECGCKLGDLAPCGEIREDCELAEFDFETAEEQGLEFFMRACPPNTLLDGSGEKYSEVARHIVEPNI